MVLEQPLAEITSKIDQATAALRASTLPYLYIAGEDLDPGYRRWLDTHLPAAMVDVWPSTGHFPHLADPHRFARCLADTAHWVVA
jgi:pimeloyl-ACP methyl ester carboxylesterase